MSDKKKKIQYLSPVKLKILKVFKYKEADIMIQTWNFMFQAVIAYKGNFYQIHNFITPQKGQKKLTIDEVVTIIAVIEDQCIATIEQLIQNADPNYKPTQEQQAGQEIVDVLEKSKDMN